MILIKFYQGYMLSTWFIIDDINLDHLASVSGFSTVKLLFLLSILYTRRKLLHTTHTQGVKSIYIHYLKFFCMRDLSILFNLHIYLFNHLFLSIWSHEYLKFGL